MTATATDDRASVRWTQWGHVTYIHCTCHVIVGASTGTVPGLGLSGWCAWTR